MCGSAKCQVINGVTTKGEDTGSGRVASEPLSWDRSGFFALLHPWDLFVSCCHKRSGRKPPAGNIATPFYFLVHVPTAGVWFSPCKEEVSYGSHMAIRYPKAVLKEDVLRLSSKPSPILNFEMPVFTDVMDFPYLSAVLR